jgi:hypothetical protein
VNTALAVVVSYACPELWMMTGSSGARSTMPYSALTNACASTGRHNTTEGAASYAAAELPCPRYLGVFLDILA